MSRIERLRGQGRIVLFALLTTAWFAVLAAAPTGRAFAQDAKAKKDEKAAPAVTAPASTTTEPSNADSSSTAKKPKSMLQWAIDASGPIGFCLFLISIYFTAVVIRLFMELRLSEAVPPALVEKVETAIKERKFQEAYDACRDNNSFVSRLIRTGVANLPNGRPEAKEAMVAQSEELILGMESRITYLATIGTLGPMIGLVGTIWGMIQSFQVLATTVGGQARPDQLAQGISTALFITLEGVTLSVPAIFFYALFRNRIAKIAMESGRTADRIIAEFWKAAKQPTPKAS